MPNSPLDGSNPMLPTISAESDTGAHFKQFARVLASSGARDALAYVLGLSDYRFIGIFRFKDGKANAAIHYDRNLQRSSMTAGNYMLSAFTWKNY